MGGGGGGGENKERMYEEKATDKKQRWTYVEESMTFNLVFHRNFRNLTKKA